MASGPRRTRPSYVSMIAGSKPQVYPEDEVVRRANLRRTLDRARRKGTLRRRSRE